jgi:glycosyltransferase involved in cell wall biosynthesis
MASGSFIIAHGNEFNRAILGDDALYFNNSAGLSEVINNFGSYQLRELSVKNNMNKVIHTYNWNRICNQYEDLFNKVLQK